MISSQVRKQLRVVAKWLVVIGGFKLVPSFHHLCLIINFSVRVNNIYNEYMCFSLSTSQYSAVFVMVLYFLLLTFFI